MKRIASASLAEADLEAVVRSALERTTPVSASTERAHVLAAAAAAAEHSPTRMERSVRPRRRRLLVPRRVPTMSFSALAALFAGLPAKAAAASVVAVTAVSGLAVTDNLPTQAEPGLSTASEKAGFEVPVGPQGATTNVDDTSVQLPAEAVDGQERAAQAREEAAAKKAAALAKAAAAAAAAADEGLERAAAGAGNAEAAGSARNNADGAGNAARARAADEARENAPAAPAGGGAESGAKETEARTNAAATEDEARSNADGRATDSSADGAVYEDQARAEADSREDAARANAGGAVAP